MKRKTWQKMAGLLMALVLLLSLCATALAEGGKPVILVVSVGTGDEEALERTVEAAEKALLRAHPRYEIRRAFLSAEAAEAVGADTLERAMERLTEDGAAEVIVAPLLLTQGEDYRRLAETAAAYAEDIASLRIGLPLITETTAAALVRAMGVEIRGWERTGTALVFIADGEENAEQLALFQDALSANGHHQCYVTAAEDPAAVIAQLDGREVKRVVLVPMSLTVDAQKEEALSAWQGAMEAAGFAALRVTKALGEYNGVRELVITGLKKAQSLEDALAALPEPVAEAAEPEVEAEPTEEPETETTTEPEETEEPEAEAEPAEEPETEAPVEPEEETEPEAEAEEPEEESEPETEAEEPEKKAEAEEPEGEGEPEESAPIALVAGTYPIRVLSSSSRFSVKSAALSVAGGKMIAVLTLEGRDYGELYPGTAAQAEEATEEELIPFQWNSDGDMVFTVPVETLDTELSLAAWSIRRGCWLDRLLIFDSASLPRSAFAA